MRMNNFCETFKESWRNLPTIGGKMETNIYLNDSNIDYICFVEGPSDATFYKNITNTNISNKKLVFIRSFTKGDDDYQSGQKIGKEGVLDNYYSLLRDKKLKNWFDKYIFIVDYDYEGLIRDKGNGVVDETDKNRINTTPGYSFENIFLSDENIYKIFKWFNLSEKEAKKFILKLKQFIVEINEYNRLKSSTIVAYKESKIYNTPEKIGKSVEYKADEIFQFDFTGRYQYYYRKKLLNEQIMVMKKAINNSQIILNYYNNYTHKFINNRNFVRGHDLYNFMSCYLKQKYNINVLPGWKRNGVWVNNPNYLKIVKMLNIPIEFKNGNNELI